MVFRIIIAGQSQCDLFAKVCLIADYLSQNLPNFCYERIEKPVAEWKVWLCKINQKNKWHHCSSPIVWKELLVKGSKACYIGGSSEFLDYCYSYYKFDTFLSCENYEELVNNFGQYQKKLKYNNQISEKNVKMTVTDSNKTSYTVCISGAGNPLAMYLLSGLLEMSTGEKSISKIFIFDNDCLQNFMEYVEHECSYIGTNFSGKVVRYVEKIGLALTSCDLFIILDHVPYNEEVAVGDWLHANKKVMINLARMINASASPKLRILFPNLGPACYNASILRNQITNVKKSNVVVATSDLGLEISSVIAEIAQVPLKNMFCPPVWGFVGINHLVDVRTTIHKYNSFEPYNRYTRVKNSTLNIGTLTPEMRTMEYLMYFDESLWKKVTENQAMKSEVQMHKSVALVNTAKLWLFGPDPNDIVNLGIHCNGSFGLNLDGIFSQPARFINGEWKPASDYLLPRDAQIKLPYLEMIAELMLNLQKGELPKVISYYPCTCPKKCYNKKEVW